MIQTRGILTKELSMYVVHTFLAIQPFMYYHYYIVVHNFGGATEANEKKRGRENPSGGNYVQISSKA